MNANANCPGASHEDAAIQTAAEVATVDIRMSAMMDMILRVPISISVILIFSIRVTGVGLVGESHISPRFSFGTQTGYGSFEFWHLS